MSDLSRVGVHDMRLYMPPGGVATEPDERVAIGFTLAWRSPAHLALLASDIDLGNFGYRPLLNQIEGDRTLLGYPSPPFLVELTFHGSAAWNVDRLFKNLAHEENP